MNFVLFCEGPTEQGALPEFLRRWLNSKLTERVGVQPVLFSGWAEMVKDSPVKARLHLSNPKVIAVVALLDLYGPTFYPSDRSTVDERFEWARAHLEKKVGDVRFRQYFAVHEVEAWLLSQPELLPAPVCRKLLPKATTQPETVNFNEPPAALLNRLYQEATGRGYKKRTFGAELFRKLDPEVVRDKCPYFRKLADDLVELAKQAIADKR